MTPASHSSFMMIRAWLLVILAVTGRAADPGILWQEDFSARPETAWGELPEGWWLEGGAGGARARVHQGRLWVDAGRREVPGATVWLDRTFSGEIEVEFDVRVVASVGEVNNMNFFFLFDDSSGVGLRVSSDERTAGRYPAYHSGRLRGTILTFLTDPENRSAARVRLRQVPPFDPVLAEYTGYHAKAGRTYRLHLVRAGGRLTVRIDGRTLIDVADPRPDSAGLIGFRTWRTEVWWDNLVVRRVAPALPDSNP